MSARCAHSQIGISDITLLLLLTGHQSDSPHYHDSYRVSSGVKEREGEE